VTVFFVLSGFLITNLLLTSTVEGRAHLPEFYATRAVRLLPALLLLLVGAGSLWLLQGRSASSLTEQSLLAVLYLEDFFHGRHDGDLFVHTWSLSVEEQFYLLWPFALPILLRAGVRGRLAVLSAAILGSLLLRLAMVLLGAGNQAFASLPSNGYALLLGCALALLPVPALRSYWWAMAGTAVLLWGFFGAPGLPFGGRLAPVVVATAAGLLVLSLLGGHPLYGWRPLRYLGRVSYAWYLWHWPLLLLTGTLNDPPRGVLVALLALGVAVASTHLVEEPLRRAWRRRLRRRKAAVAGAADPAAGERGAGMSPEAADGTVSSRPD
jgi:peptidoglycan/LPS O-acetylase OafA/YrhL